MEENLETEIVYEKPIEEDQNKQEELLILKPKAMDIYESLEADYKDVEAFMSKKEFTRIERNNDIRDMLIQSLLSDGAIPKDTKKIRLIKEILLDQDSSINNNINTKLKNKEMNTEGKFKEAALELLHNLKDYNSRPERDDSLDFKTNLKDTIEIVDGHLKTGVVQLNPNDFIKDN